MSLSLPEPRADRLARSPLQLVVCQVRYARASRASRLGPARAVQAALGGESSWQLSQIESRKLTVAAVEPTAPSYPSLEAETGWRLTSLTPSWSATLMPDNVALETTRYESWHDFSDRLRPLLASVKKDVRPEAVGRIGVRYIDRIQDPAVDEPGQWARWIQPAALGIVCHAALGNAIIGCQQQVDLAVDATLKATIRHGLVQDEESGRFHYIMDFDTYREGVREFNVVEIHADLDRLHRLSIQLFQAMITDELYDYLRGDA